MRGVTPPRGNTVLRVVAALYLLGILLEGIGCSAPALVLPKPADYFLQIAGLFPVADKSASQYRAEGYVCAERRWQELQTRPYFPLDPDDKENRFQRALQFYWNEKPAMSALDGYLVDRHNAGKGDDGIPRGSAIGGIRILSVRVPIPPPGSQLERYRWRPLSDYPEDERHYKGFYRTPPKKVDERCGFHEAAPSSSSDSVPTPVPDMEPEPALSPREPE